MAKARIEPREREIAYHCRRLQSVECRSVSDLPPLVLAPTVRDAARRPAAAVTDEPAGDQLQEIERAGYLNWHGAVTGRPVSQPAKGVLTPAPRRAKFREATGMPAETGRHLDKSVSRHKLGQRMWCQVLRPETAAADPELSAFVVTPAVSRTVRKESARVTDVEPASCNLLK
jgi:hypothetical protein